MKLFLIVSMSLAIAACATGGPDTGEPEPVPVVQPGGDDLPADGIDESPTPGDAGTSVAVNSSDSTKEEIVCKRVKPTGSRVAVRVCRSRTDISEREKADQDVLRRGLRNDRTGLDPN